MNTMVWHTLFVHLSYRWRFFFSTCSFVQCYQPLQPSSEFCQLIARLMNTSLYSVRLRGGGLDSSISGFISTPRTNFYSGMRPPESSTLSYSWPKQGHSFMKGIVGDNWKVECARKILDSLFCGMSSNAVSLCSEMFHFKSYFAKSTLLPTIRAFNLILAKLYFCFPGSWSFA